MKTISISEVTRARLERLTNAQSYAVETCNNTCNECFMHIATNIQVYAASHIRCAQSNLANSEETPRRALSALVWLSKTVGVVEICSSDARHYVRNLTANATPQYRVPDNITSAINALAVYEARAFEVAVSLQCDIEE